jgi:hypothetical protein
MTNAPNSRPNADDPRKAGQPQYQPVEQADDEEIAQTQRQSRSTNPADDVPVQVSGEDQDESEEFEEEWMDDRGNEVTPEERVVSDYSNETSGGRRPGKRKGTRGGDSPIS